MSHITQAQQGLAAAEARNYDEAITKLSAALKASLNPTWLIARSRALISKSRFQEALQDADLAWHAAYDRNKRPQMVEAHYRRAVAYFRLKEYANADACCIYAMRMVKGEKVTTKEDPAAAYIGENGLWKATLDDAKKEATEDPLNKGGVGMAMQEKPSDQAKEWRTASALRMQILGAMDKLDPEADGRRFSTSYKPGKRPLQDLDSKHEKAAEEPSSKDGKARAEPAASGITSQSVAKPVVPADAPLRLQDFQSSTYMSVSVFSKGNNKENVRVEFTASSVHLRNVVFPNGDRRDHLIELWGQIDPEKSTYTVTPNKIELKLIKAVAGNWKALRSAAGGKPLETRASQAAPSAVSQEAPAPTASSPDDAPKPAPPSATAARPAYPTSSRQGPTNWDKVAEDEDDGQEDGGDVNGFFKKLFKNATPEQQRAMVKSFTESNGTSLSTDWTDVGSRTVESVPPEGMEAKKYES